MSKIAETLRATLLSLKQISDRLKLLITTSVTKTEASADKNEILSAIQNIPEPDLSTVAKQGDNPDATNTAIYNRINTVDAHIGDVETVLDYVAGGSVDEVIDSYTAEYSETIDSMVGDWNSSDDLSDN